jgi:hypothetical protein
MWASVLALTLGLGTLPAVAQYRPFPNQQPVQPYYPPVIPGQNCAPGQQVIPPAQTLPQPQPQPGQLPEAPSSPSPDASAMTPGAGNFFAPTETAGAPTGATANPPMFGDIIGGSYARVIRSGTGTAHGIASIPNLSRGAFKIADNESPRPLDRVFLTYSYYDGVRDLAGNTSTFNVNREVFGFEKTFFDGNASFELRVPFIEANNLNANGIEANQIGDLTFIGKWALINNCQTGDVLSVGLAVTVPTGQAFVIEDGTNIHSTLLQPFIGYMYNFDRFYIHGFSSLVIPTQSEDATLWFNDIGLGYWLMRNNCDSLITGIAPTLEAHILTPLNHRGVDNFGVGVPDWVVLCGGVNVVLHGGSSVGVCLAAPVTNPRPYDVQALVTFNFRF